MDTNKKEIRTCDVELQIREVEGQEPGASRIIEGTAIVFNAESRVLDSNGMEFREIIKPEAATQTFLNQQDIKLNIMHNRTDTVARSMKGRGNMKVWADGKGVNFRAEIPKCDIGDRALELTRSGVLTGCSFEFLPKDYDVEERGANKEVRVIHREFAKITALTLAMDPAYSQTSVNARELWNETPTAKREAEEAAEAARLKAEEEARELEQEKITKRERERSAARRRIRERELEAMTL